MQDGRPISINIELMKFISDTNSTVPENPNGFRIENLNETRTIQVQPGCKVAPLIDAGYGLYTIPNIENWIDDEGRLAEDYASYADFTSSYYEFIVRDNAVLQIFEKYIP